jgi:hypothetical protein
LTSTPISPSTTGAPSSALSHFGSASSLRAMAEAAKAAQAVQAATVAQAPEATTPGSPPASSSSMKSLELTDSLVPTSGETPTSQGATGTSDSVQGAQVIERASFFVITKSDMFLAHNHSISITKHLDVATRGQGC